MTSPKRPGRKRLAEGEDTSEVTVRLPESMHDAAIAAAKQAHEGSVSALLRTALKRYLSRYYVSTNTSS